MNAQLNAAVAATNRGQQTGPEGAFKDPNDQDQLPGRLQSLETTESKNAGPVNCSKMILIMASEGRVGACPKGKRSRC
jgi:hypothetical protein